MLARKLCHETISYLVDRGFLPGYVNSGPCRSRGGERVHYNELFGDLYCDTARWEQSYQLVQSFMHKSLGQSRFWMPEIFGRIPIRVADLLTQLPSVLSRYGFECFDRNDASQSLKFRSKDSCEVKHLPEPYGKWLQHQRHDVAWDRRTELEVVIECQLRAVDGATFLDLVSSTLILSLLGPMADDLNRLLHLTDSPLGCPIEAVRSGGRFLLKGQPVSLACLSYPAFLVGLYQGQRMRFSLGNMIEPVDLCEYFHFTSDGCVQSTVDTPDFLQVADQLWKGTDGRLKRGRYRLDGSHVEFSFSNPGGSTDFQGSVRGDGLELVSLHSITGATESGWFRRVTWT